MKAETALGVLGAAAENGWLKRDTILGFLVGAAVGGVAVWWWLSRDERENPSSRRWKRGSEVQSVLFPKGRYSKIEARSWARRHGYRSGKVDESANYFRIRQRSPESGGEKRTITFGKGIKAIIQEVT